MLHFTIRKRTEPLGWQSWVIFLGAVVFSLLVCGWMLALQGKPAVEGMRAFFQGGFGSQWALEDSLVKAVPIYLCSLGVGIAFRLQIWNIGAEGQYALGAIGATWAALTFPDLPGAVLLPLMLVCATIAGGLWGFIPAILKLRMRANEIIVSLMLNYIGIRLLEYLVYGIWKDTQSFGFPMTAEFTPAAVIPAFGMSRVHWGLVLCVGIGVAMTLFLRFSRTGYELKISGESVRAAKYARIPYGKLVILVMLVSGALAGWAGFVETSATLGRLQPSVMAGYGYTAIVVAWLAKLSPLRIGIASFLLAGVRVGVETLQLDFQVPEAFSSIMEGLILISVLASQFFTHYHFERLTKK
ncbi:MAG: ABC transporter permease [Thermodesulfobacteriota bacterium]